jgi:glycerate-2-kinase
MEQRILNMEALTSHGNIAGRKAMAAILEAGLEASDPYYNTKKLLRLEGNTLTVGGGKEFEPTGTPWTGDRIFDLTKIKNIWVFGAGKGIQRVAKALEDALGDRLTGGHVVDKKGHPIICTKVGVTLGAHPAPDIDCVRGCEKIYAGLQKVTKDDLVFTIGSNGFSALLTLPVAGLTIDDVSEVTRVMQIVHGAPTHDLNAIRNHIDVLKGGRISRYIHQAGAKAVHLVACEPGNWELLMADNRWLHNLAEGSTFQTAIDAINKFDAWDEIPKPVKDFLQKADPKWETVKKKEFESFNDYVLGIMPGYRQTVKLPAAMKKAEELGFKPMVISEDIFTIEARQAGLYMAAICKTIERAGYPFNPPVALFSSGEMLVTVGKETGIGGRNQEFCLSGATSIAGSKNIVFGSVDTDGTDGPGIQYAKGLDDMPECLAGGIVDGETMEEARRAGVNVLDELKRHNTSPPLWKLGSAVWATPNISVIDLTVGLVMGRSK